MRLALLVVVLACRGTPRAPEPVAAATGTTYEPAPPTCAEVAIIMRGSMVESDEATAGTEHEAAIARTCEATRWPSSVLACIATEPRWDGCLSALTPGQREAYAGELDAWRARYIAAAAADNQPPPEIACEDAIGDPALYPAPLPPDAPEREWVIRVRRNVLVHECEHGWSAELKDCLAGANTAGGIAGCLDDELAATERDELTGELGELDKLAARTAAAQKKPASLGCKRVVAVHYGDARWKGKLAGYSAPQRKKLIADSRARMQKACTDTAWSSTLRACIVAGGETTCFESFGMALSWGYPAAGVVDTLGIPECDAYGKTIERIVACDALPASTRDALREMYAQTKSAMAGATASVRGKLATSCKAGRVAIEQVALSSGC